MPDAQADSERRLQLVNTLLILTACSAIRALQEVTFVYTTRQASWGAAILWTLPSWLFLVPLASGTMVLARRFPFDRRNRLQSVAVHLAGCLTFGIVHLVVITPFRALIAGDPFTWTRLTQVFMVAFRLLFTRIHRSTIVQIDRIGDIVAAWHGDFDVTLRDGTVLRLSRNYRERVLNRKHR